MASPQAEDGHTDISNEIMDAICKIRIPGEARQVLDFILRKTYGWHKKEDCISLSQFVEGTGLNKVHICRSITVLINMNLVTKKGNAQSLFTKKGNDNFVIYGFQKDFDKWNTLPKKVTLPNRVKYVTQKGNLTLPKKVHTKETITKETITKEILGEFQNVKLSKSEIEKLEKRFNPIGAKDRIEKLSQYIASKGKKYSNHYATILSWERLHPQPIKAKKATLSPGDYPYFKDDPEIIKMVKGFGKI